MCGRNAGKGFESEEQAVYHCIFAALIFAKSDLFNVMGHWSDHGHKMTCDCGGGKVVNSDGAVEMETHVLYRAAYFRVVVG